MLPSKFRLKLPSKWNRNYPDYKVNTEYFKLIGKKVEGATNPRIGFIISTKVGKAVVRNRVRRQLETLLKPHLVESTQKLEVIIIVYPNLVKSKNEDLSLTVNSALSKVHL